MGRQSRVSNAMNECEIVRRNDGVISSRSNT